MRCWVGLRAEQLSARESFVKSLETSMKEQQRQIEVRQFGTPRVVTCPGRWNDRSSVNSRGRWRKSKSEGLRAQCAFIFEYPFRGKDRLLIVSW